MTQQFDLRLTNNNYLEPTEDDELQFVMDGATVTPVEFKDAVGSLPRCIGVMLYNNTEGKYKEFYPRSSIFSVRRKAGF